MNVDMLIETLVSDAQLAVGTDPTWLQKNGGIVRPASGGSRSRMPIWTKEEDEFLRSRLGDLGIEGVAEALGRSANAVKNHFKRRGIPAASKQPGWLTGNQAARLLGIDAHKITRWIDEGIMPGERLSWSVRVIRRVSMMQFKMWLIRPSTWVYIDIDKIAHPSLRRLAQLARRRWGDEWWSTRQAADYHGCDDKDILRQIKIGRIAGVQTRHRGGRGQGRWSFWFIRRSEAERLEIYRGKGSGHDLKVWTERADQYLLKARSEGLLYREIASRMKWPEKRVIYRLQVLAQRGKK